MNPPFPWNRLDYCIPNFFKASINQRSLSIIRHRLSLINFHWPTLSTPLHRTEKTSRNFDLDSYSAAFERRYIRRREFLNKYEMTHAPPRISSLTLILFTFPTSVCGNEETMSTDFGTL